MRRRRARRTSAGRASADELREPPRMPFGRNSTTAISSTPIQKYQYCGLIAGELVARDHVDDGADQPAVEPAGAAENEDDQHVGRALEARARRARPSRSSAPAARRRRRPSPPRWCRSCGYAGGSARRSRGMRTAFSRMPRSDRPNGELISRRATRKDRNSTIERIAVGGVAVEIELEQRRGAATSARPAGRRRRR